MKLLIRLSLVLGVVASSWIGRISNYRISPDQEVQIFKKTSQYSPYALCTDFLT